MHGYGLKDKRYKLTQQDVNDIRELKKLGFTNKELALAFAVSESTTKSILYVGVNFVLGVLILAQYAVPSNIAITFSSLVY